ncbi:MAG: VWA domain-containing protein [Anaerolineales bacterium]|jgi:Ca-activated chloride channel family protein|nr:VWA domain-containing protein [Anaerolineales bacterium]
MNTKFFFNRSIILIALISLLISACAAATPKTVATEERQEVVKTVEVYAVEEPAAEQQDRPAYEPTAAPAPSTNQFEDYGVNPYTAAVEDHLSTFALDVDTASYSVMRRYLKDGNLPPAESVRVEEYVNYFNQGYPTPEDIAFGLYADGAPSPFDPSGTYILRFGVQGYQVPEWERKSASLTFVIDVSGSMQLENRLELVKRSLELLVERLNPEDMVSIVVYGTNARVVLFPTSGRDASTILNAIYSLQPEGTTNAAAGLKLGYEMAMQSFRAGMTNRIILCSDGVANVGRTEADEILDTVRGYVSEGIYLTTVGFGMGNFNDTLMEQLADDGNGNYAYIDDLDEAEKLFVEDLTSTLQVIARDAKVQVDFNPDVVSYYRLVGYENRAVADEDFRDDSVDAGELGAGHSVTALYAVVLQAGAEGRIATVQLRWEDPETYVVREINGNFNTWDLANSFEEAASRYQLAVLVGQYADVLRGSPWAQQTSLSNIYFLAGRLLETLSDDPDVLEFVELVGRAAQIRP